MARGDYPSAKQDQFVLRFPDGMRERIKQAADANRRSMNAEIIAALEEKFPDPNRVEDESKFVDEIMEIQARLDRLLISRAALELRKTDSAIAKADELLKKRKDDKK